MDTKKIEEFKVKLDALCTEYEFTLQVNQGITIVPNPKAPVEETVK